MLLQVALQAMALWLMASAAMAENTEVIVVVVDPNQPKGKPVPAPPRGGSSKSTTCDSGWKKHDFACHQQEGKWHCGDFWYTECSWFETFKGHCCRGDWIPKSSGCYNGWKPQHWCEKKGGKFLCENNWWF